MNDVFIVKEFNSKDNLIKVIDNALSFYLLVINFVLKVSVWIVFHYLINYWFVEPNEIVIDSNYIFVVKRFCLF